MDRQDIRCGLPRVHLSASPSQDSPDFGLDRDADRVFNQPLKPYWLSCFRGCRLRGESSDARLKSRCPTIKVSVFGDSRLLGQEKPGKNRQKELEKTQLRIDIKCIAAASPVGADERDQPRLRTQRV